MDDTSPAEHGRRSPPGLIRAAILLVLGSAGLATPGLAQEAANRGAYLAAITGCVSCHSPHDAAGHVREGRLLAGGDHPIHVAGGGAVYPPNITPDQATGIGSWSVQDIVTVLHDGRTPDGRILSAAMPWRTQYAMLAAADADAIAAYVHSVPAARLQPPAGPADR